MERKDVVDKPGIIGASWWQEGLDDPIPRRTAVTALLAVGGALAAALALGTCVATSARSCTTSTPDFEVQARGALDMQKEFGWDFGARGEALVFDGKQETAFDRARLAALEEECAPARADLRPFFVPTLLQSLAALPKSAPSGEDGLPPFVPLKDAIVPVATPAMEQAFQRGKSLAALVLGARGEWPARLRHLAFTLDLPGPEAVAFAAGAADALDPVFLFDNWPHPRGVVPAHLTLAAAAYYQPLFAKARAARSAAAPALFVLDRGRLAPYTDDALRFDNRHVAQLPSGATLARLGVTDLVYVSPSDVAPVELDDLVDRFVALAAARVALFALAIGAIPAPSGAAPDRFWSGTLAHAYTPTPRSTVFAGGARPAGFGAVPVAVALGTGVILGATMSRSGSWNRTTSSGGGG